MAYLFSSESVSEGHPDKVADQISDALLDQFLAYDDKAHCAIETFNTTGQVVIMGEVRSTEYVDLQTVARKTIDRIGYNKAEYQFDSKSCGILTAIHEQSEDIDRGVSREDEEAQGAGDQGMMFGYACNETANYMPVTLDLAHLIMRTLADIRKEGKQMTYLRPDSKSQVTVEYSDEGVPQRIVTIVVSTQHDPFMDDDEAMLAQIQKDVEEILMPRVKAQIESESVLALFNDDIQYLVNPTGKFVIGGPHGDTGLTGRKIIVDTYGKLRWQEGEADGHPLLCIVSEQVSEEYLETLRTLGISWIAAGAERIDLPQAMELLHEHFGVERLAIVGGGHICGSFLEAGLIDEVSIMVAPGIDGRKGQTAVFDGISRMECNPYKLKLESVEQWETDIVWLRYKVK